MATLQTLPIELLDLIFKHLSLSNPESLQSLALSSSKLYDVALGMQATFSHFLETEFGTLLGEALLAIRSRGLDLFDHTRAALRIIEIHTNKEELELSSSVGEMFRLFIFHQQLLFLVKDHEKNAPRPMVKVDDETFVHVPLPILSETEMHRFVRALCRIQIYRNLFTPPEISLDDYQSTKKEFRVTNDDDFDADYKLAYRLFFGCRPHWENAEIGSVLWYMERRHVSFYEEIYNDMLDIVAKQESQRMKEEETFASFSQDVREVYDRFCHLDTKWKSNKSVQWFFNLFNHRIDVMKQYQPEASSSPDQTIGSLDNVYMVYDSMVHSRQLSPASVESDLPAGVGDLFKSMLDLAEKYEAKDRGQFELLSEDVRPSFFAIRSLERLRILHGSSRSTFPTESLAAMGPEFLYRAMHAERPTRRHMILAHAAEFKKTTLQDGIINPEFVFFPHPEQLAKIGDFHDWWQTLPATEQPNMAWKRLHIHGYRDDRLDESIQYIGYPLAWRWSYALWDDDRLDGWGEEFMVE